MICKECGADNKTDALLCKECGELLDMPESEEEALSHITIDFDPDEDDYEAADEDADRMSRGMIAAIITVASMLVVVIVVLGVLLLGGKTNAAAAEPTIVPA